jgi:Carboxypeptidase regulatory-like domain
MHLSSSSFTRIVFAFTLLLALSFSTIHAQVLTGTLNGTVTDASDSVIPGANVTIVDLSSGKEYKDTTDAQGDFSITNLNNGMFKVTVEHAGFSKTIMEQVQVFASQTSKINVKLQVAKTGTEIVVEANQTQVQTESIELKNTIERKQFENIPLPTRNPLDLVKSMAGILSPNASGNGMTGGDAFVHGLRGNTTNLTQDGINVQDNFVKTSAFFALSAPIADTIGEMSVSVGGIGADAGFGASQVSMITVRGTNEFHGSAFWFERTRFLNANSFFSNSQGLPRPFQLQNRLGATGGGPVWIPKIYKGKNRTFVFGAYEAYREPRSQPRTRTVFTPSAEQGLITYTPTTGGAPVTVNLLNVGTIGTTGIKPAINPLTMGVYTKIVPQTGYTDSGCTNGDGINVRCIALNLGGVNNADRYTVRVDHKLTEKHALEFVWNQDDPITTPDFLNGIEPIFPNTPFTSGGQGSRRQVFVWALQSVINASQTNEFRVGYQRAPVNFLYGYNFADTGGYQVSFATATSPILTSTNLPQGRNTVSRQVIDNYAWVKGSHQMRFGAELHQLDATTYVYSRLYPVVTLGTNAVNSNNLSATTLPGISAAELTIANGIFNDAVGLLGSQAEGLNHTSPTSGYVPGVPQQYTPITHNFAAYWQDSWKIRRNITLQYGVRWEYDGPYDVRNGLVLLPQNNVAGLFGPTPVGGYFAPGNTNGATDSLLTLQGSTAAGSPTTNPDRNNFGPFIGLAWAPGHDNKTSVRASFATHYALDGLTFWTNATTANTGLFTTLTNSTPTGVLTSSPLSFPAAPSGTFPVSEVSNYYNLGQTAQELAYDPKIATPYVLEWSLGIQREIGKKFTTEVRYVGNHAVKQYKLFNIDELNLNSNGLMNEFIHAQQNLAVDTANKITGFGYNGLPGQTPTPILDKIFAGLAATSGYSNSTFITNLNQNNVQTMFSSIRNSPTYTKNVLASFPVNFFVANPWASGAFLVNNAGWSYFDGLEVDVKRRFTSGFFMSANYTFSKVLTDSTFAESQNEQTNYQSILNTRLDKFRAAFDVRHNVSFNFLYPIPVGRGKQFGGNMPKILDYLAGGWSLNGFTKWSTGSPINISSQRATVQSAGGTAGVTPVLNNMTAKQLQDNIGVYRTGNGVYWLNPDLNLFTIKGSSSTTNFCTAGQTTPCFAVPNPGQFGNLPIYGFSGPHFFDQDASLVKDTVIHERLKFQIRLEAFDVFNNVNFTGAQTGTDGTTFGQLTATADTARGGGVTARIVQWAARITF